MAGPAGVRGSGVMTLGIDTTEHWNRTMKGTHVRMDDLRAAARLRAEVVASDPRGAATAKFLRSHREHADAAAESVDVAAQIGSAGAHRLSGNRLREGGRLTYVDVESKGVMR